MSQSAVEAIAAHFNTAQVKLYDSEAGRLFDGKTETPAGNYAVLYASEGLRSSDSLSGEVDRADVDFQITSVGTTPRGARWVAARAAGLAGATLPLGSGREGRVNHLASNPVRRDTDRPDVTVFYGTDAFTLITPA